MDVNGSNTKSEQVCFCISTWKLLLKKNLQKSFFFYNITAIFRAGKFTFNYIDLIGRYMWLEIKNNLIMFKVSNSKDGIVWISAKMQFILFVFFFRIRSTT